MSEMKFTCPECGQHLEGDTEAARMEVECPTCQARFRPEPRPAVRVESEAPPPDHHLTPAKQLKELRAKTAYGGSRVIFDVLVGLSLLGALATVGYVLFSVISEAVGVGLVAGCGVGALWVIALRGLAHALFDIADSLRRR